MANGPYGNGNVRKQRLSALRLCATVPVVSAPVRTNILATSRQLRSVILMFIHTLIHFRMVVGPTMTI